MSNRSFRTSCYGHIRLSVTDSVVSCSNIIGTCSTCRYNTVVRPPESIFYGYLSGNQIRNQHWNKERRNPTCSTIVEFDRLVIECFHSTNSGSYYNSYTIFINRFQIDATILNSFFRSNQCVLRNIIQSTGFFSIEIVRRLIFRDCSGKFCRESFSIEVLNGFSTTFT